MQVFDPEFSRRDCLTAISCLATGFLAGCGTDSPPKAFGLVPQIDSGFCETSQALIQEAFVILNRELLSLKVKSNMHSIRSDWEPSIREQVWDTLLVEQFNEAHENVMAWQLKGLSATQVPVRIGYMNKDSARWGSAYVGVVESHVESNGNVRFDGTFSCQLNEFHFKSKDQWQANSPDVWAIVIAHELLHNLGHRHGDRSQLTQMIAFERCLYYRGSYEDARQCPVYECGAIEKSDSDKTESEAL